MGTVFLCIGCFVVGAMVGIGSMCLMIVGGADSERGRDCNNEDRQDKEVGTVFLCIGCFVVGAMVGIGSMCLMIVGGADSERGRDCNNEDRQDKEG